MKRIRKDRAFAIRAKSLGTLGELFAMKALVDSGFSEIRNLNDSKRNFPYADLFAVRERRMVISVKCRNRYQRDGALNSRYKLGARAYEHAHAAENALDAVAYWMAIQFDRETYSVYLGSLEQLNGKMAIPMSPEYLDDYTRLVCDANHFLDFEPYLNRYDEDMAPVDLDTQ